MEIAVKLALTSDERMRHGCVIVKNGRVLGLGVNKYRNNPFNVTQEHIRDGCSTHAEMSALRQTTDARGSKVYVARMSRQGNKLLSRPCNGCYKALELSGIKEVIYT